MALKFNIGDTKQVTMKYDTGKQVDGKFGPQVMFGVEVDGQDDYWYVSPFVSGLFESNGVKAGDILTVTRSGQKQYVYMKDGQVLMTKPGNKPNTTPAGSASYTVGNVMSGDIDNILRRLKLLETEVAFIKGKLVGMESKKPVEANFEPPTAMPEEPPPPEPQPEIRLEDIPF